MRWGQVCSLGQESCCALDREMGRRGHSRARNRSALRWFLQRFGIPARVSGPGARSVAAAATMGFMIARRWTGWAEGPENADAYVAHFEDQVRRHLEATDGFVDARVERMADDRGCTELVVVTRWISLDAIRAFAGDEIDVAVVEPAARAVLCDFDRNVRHIELADGEAFGTSS